jgi:hypothetical protein
MPTIDKKAISEALREAMNKEDLHTRQAASFLNLNPCYVSRVLNPKHWDSMSKTARERLQEWFESREPIKDFKIPEGEEIWKPKEKAPSAVEITLKKSDSGIVSIADVKKSKRKEKPIYGGIAANLDKMITGNQRTEKALTVKINASPAPNIESMKKEVEYELKETEPYHIPIILDLKINIEVQLFGKTLNIPLS